MAEHIIAAGAAGSSSPNQQVIALGPEQGISDALAALTIWMDAATQGSELDTEAANTLQFTINRIAVSIEEASFEAAGAEDEDVFCARQFLLLIDRALWNFVGGEIKSPPDPAALVRTARIAATHMSRIAASFADANGGAQ